MFSKARRATTARWSRLTLASIIGGVLLLSLLGACGSAEPTATATPAPATPTAPNEPTATPPPALEPWEIEWNEVVAKAREEGELILLGGSAALYYQPVWDRFQEKFGIEIKVTGGSSRVLVDRVLAERAAGRFTVDAFLSGPGTWSGRMIPNGLLDPVAEAFILPEVIDESLWLGGKHTYLDPDEKKYVFAHSMDAGVDDRNARFNTEKVSEEDFLSVDSVWSFLDDRWRGRIVTLAPFRDTDTGEEYYHPDLGKPWLEKFFAEMDVLFLDDERLIIDTVLAGGRDLCVPCSRMGTTLDALADAAGAPIGNFQARWDDWTETLIMGGSSPGHTTMHLNHPKNPNAEKVFINWFLSKEGQTARHVLTTDREPPQSLRVDVTEMGNTNPALRRKEGFEYYVKEQIAGYDTLESGTFKLELYQRTR